MKALRTSPSRSRHRNELPIVTRWRTATPRNICSAAPSGASANAVYLSPLHRVVRRQLRVGCESEPGVGEDCRRSSGGEASCATTLAPAIRLGGRSLPATPCPAEYESLLVAFGQSEADRALGPRRWGDQLSQCLKDPVQLLVMLAELRLGLSLKIFKAPLDRGVRDRSAS
jgi:hypothetical protein